MTDTQGTGAEPGWPGAVATHQDDEIAFLETWADLSCRGRIQNKDFPSHAETHCHLWKSIISDYFQLKTSQFYVRDIVMGFFFLCICLEKVLILLCHKAWQCIRNYLEFFLGTVCESNKSYGVSRSKHGLSSQEKEFMNTKNNFLMVVHDLAHQCRWFTIEWM